MNRFVEWLDDIDGSDVALVGGKAARLGAMARLPDIEVPRGFCITTSVFDLAMAGVPGFEGRVAALSRLAPNDPRPIRELSAALRRDIASVAIPGDVAAATGRALAMLGEADAYAVRSSATGEDHPGASTAGQHDSYLNVVGLAAVLDHVRRCWASLFSERAVTYRLRAGGDRRDWRTPRMAVVVQRMVVPRASGILFTADPMTGNRKVASVEATPGLGEALASGLVNPDSYRVRDALVVERAIADDAREVIPPAPGGAERRPTAPERQRQAVLTDAELLHLAALGRRIEAHFGGPQDIEWCLAGDRFHLVQSRPITTLFPVPERDDGANRVYISVGHQQMMTDAMKPLGVSIRQLTAGPPMYEAAGRLFVDATGALASPASRDALLALVGRSEPLIVDALRTVIARGFVAPAADDASPGAHGAASGAPAPAAIDTDPAIPAQLVARNEASVAALKRDVASRTGLALLDVLQEDFHELRRLLFEPLSHQAIMAGMEATWWINDHVLAWLGEASAADTLSQSVPDNVTSQMGLALLDVADAIRPHPEVVAFLEHDAGEDFLAELPSLPGGAEARDAIEGWLTRYGMRCVGEVDITRPRWRERPITLVPLILTNIRNFEPGAAARRFAEGQRAASAKEEELLEQLRALPDGAQKAADTKRTIDRLRTFIGYREYPKYGMITRYFVYKQALMAEAERLVQAGVLRDAEDIFYLTFPELRDAVRTQRVEASLIERRKEAFRWYQALTPPRVLTSEGEAIDGAYRRDGVPVGALVGLAVSAGTVEGRARVIVDITAADVAPGDILVTPHTDPSWTPLFVTVAGLVTEVGGLMTHGAVIAREYGLPAVVGVEHATRLIRDGDRIRVHGTAGYVEIL